MVKRFSFLFFLVGVLLVTLVEGTGVVQEPRQSVYVVTRNRYSEGSTRSGPTARLGDLIMIEIARANGQSPDRVYEVGRSYALFVGGERRGDVTVGKVTPFQCNSSVAVVSTGPSVQLATNAAGLATTNPEMIGPHGNVQRNATVGEIAGARQLAMEVFRKNGVPDELAKEIQVRRLVVTEVDKSGQKIVIGSLFIRANGAQHDVFLIGTAEGPAVAAQLSRYHKSIDLEDGKDAERVQFVDQLDLDRNGVDEIVIEVGGYESLAFVLYQRQNESWQQVRVGGESGC